MSVAKPLAVVIGFIGKIPLAGMSLFNLHYVAGLRALGYEVHYVERQNTPYDCYDPSADAMADDPQYAVGYLSALMPRFGFTRNRFSFIDSRGRCEGSGWKSLLEALDRADFILTLCDLTWFDELEQCRRRAFVDGDPMFTQVRMLSKDEPVSDVLKHYDTLFTYGVRIGQSDCTIPSAGRDWIPTRPVVSTAFWKPEPAADDLPLTTVMNWADWQDVQYEGRTYGQKNREFLRFKDLPSHTNCEFLLAVGGAAPLDSLRQSGWNTANPLKVTQTVEAYQRFIAGSRADFGIAKHAYVASRSGWFSDRATCYLASGRPVLHQDTGCGDWLPTVEGVFLFRGLQDVLAALSELEGNYDRHASTARRLAEEHFEAKEVVGRMLDEARYR